MLLAFNDSHSGSLQEYQFNWGTWNIKLCHAIPNNIGWSLPNNMKRFYEACRYFWTNWERGGSVEWWDKVCSEVLGKPDINAINREREHNNILFREILGKHRNHNLLPELKLLFYDESHFIISDFTLHWIFPKSSDHNLSLNIRSKNRQTLLLISRKIHNKVDIHSYRPSSSSSLCNLNKSLRYCSCV